MHTLITLAFALELEKYVFADTYICMYVLSCLADNIWGIPRFTKNQSCIFISLKSKCRSIFLVFTLLIN